MIRELNHKFKIDSVSIISMNDYVNISQVPFPAVTITIDAISLDSDVIDGDLSSDE